MKRWGGAGYSGIFLPKEFNHSCQGLYLESLELKSNDLPTDLCHGLDTVPVKVLIMLHTDTESYSVQN